MSESQLVNACLQYLQLKGVFCYRQNSGAYKTERGGFVRYGTTGAPDIVAVIKGQYVGIECKMPRGKQTDGQKLFEGKLKQAGGQYWIVRDVEELIKALNEKSV